MKNYYQIRSQFCTCHDSWAVVTCAVVTWLGHKDCEKSKKYPQAYHSEIISCDMGFWFYQNYEVKWLEDWIHKLTAKITSCALSHWHLGKWKSFQNMLAQIIVYCLSCVRLYTGSMMTYCQLGEHTSTNFASRKYWTFIRQFPFINITKVCSWGSNWQ